MKDLLNKLADYNLEMKVEHRIGSDIIGLRGGFFLFVFTDRTNDHKHYSINVIDHDINFNTKSGEKSLIKKLDELVKSGYFNQP